MCRYMCKVQYYAVNLYMCWYVTPCEYVWVVRLWRSSRTYMILMSQRAASCFAVNTWLAPVSSVRYYRSVVYRNSLLSRHCRLAQPMFLATNARYTTVRIAVEITYEALISEVDWLTADSNATCSTRNQWTRGTYECCWTATHDHNLITEHHRVHLPTSSSRWCGGCSICEKAFCRFSSETRLLAMAYHCM
jgi:hypothetical protein